MRAVPILFLLMVFSCRKSGTPDLPAHHAEIAVEMYLEDRCPLKCLVTQTLPYSSLVVNQMLSNARVIFSDGTVTDTLQAAELYDYESGRHYNYASSRLFIADRSKKYTLTVKDSLGKEVTSSTMLSSQIVQIDSLFSIESKDKPGNYSVGISFSDPSGSDYYRIIIGKGVNDYESGNTDILLPDIAFDGKQYSFSSPPDYRPGDTIAVRLYTLIKEHYEYLQSAEGARTANFNPFMQPVRVKGNIAGGQGIFAAIQYEERKILVR